MRLLNITCKLNSLIEDSKKQLNYFNLPVLFSDSSAYLPSIFKTSNSIPWMGKFMTKQENPREGHLGSLDLRGHFEMEGDVCEKLRK